MQARPGVLRRVLDNWYPVHFPLDCTQPSKFWGNVHIKTKGGDVFSTGPVTNCDLDSDGAARVSTRAGSVYILGTACSEKMGDAVLTTASSKIAHVRSLLGEICVDTSAVPRTPARRTQHSTVDRIILHYTTKNAETLPPDETWINDMYINTKYINCELDRLRELARETRGRAEMTWVDGALPKCVLDCYFDIAMSSLSAGRRQCLKNTIHCLDRLLSAESQFDISALRTIAYTVYQSKGRD